jgi:hypothetical protein
MYKVTKSVRETGKKPNGFIQYGERIEAIMTFFGVSKEAAGFVYHRKRRGFPFTKKTDPKFLEWTLKLQNALIKADECVSWDWVDLKFGEEEKILAQNDIFVDNQSDTVIFKHDKKEEEADGWTTVKNDKKNKQRRNKTLQIMGFVPRPMRHYPNKYKNPEKKSTHENSLIAV